MVDSLVYAAATQGGPRTLGVELVTVSIALSVVTRSLLTPKGVFNV